MQHPSQKWADQTWAECRRLFEAGQSVRQIARGQGVPPSSIYSRARREGWVRAEVMTLRRTLTPALPSRAGRRRMIARLYSAFDRQVSDLEARLEALEGPGAQEPDARMLATLARTLDRLTAIDRGERGLPPATGSGTAKGGAGDGAAGRAERARGGMRQEGGIDDFRRELARRLEALRAEGDRAPAGGA